MRRRYLLSLFGLRCNLHRAAEQPSRRSGVAFGVTLGLRRACLPALHELRNMLGARGLSEGYRDRLAALELETARLPALRVLEVDIPCALRLRLARRSS